ncbi:MAG: aldehyde dehydrogenase family protein [Candidatus Fimivivens sp.]
MASKELTPDQFKEFDEIFERAQKAAAIIATYDQARVDHLCRAVGWAITNLKTWEPLCYEVVEETGLGDPISKIGKRNKVRGMLRDALRGKSVGVIEEIPEKGLVKYAKPIGIIASLVPTTNPTSTPAGQSMYAIKARDAIIFSPHPRAKQCTAKCVQIMREALVREGAPADILQVIEEPSLAKTDELMKRADLIIATGGRPMVKAAYSSGTPAFGSGAGNSTMIYDETADPKEAAKNTRISKTSDFGSGCSCDGNLIIHASIFDATVEALKAEGAYFANEEEKELIKRVMWDENGHRLPETVAIPPQKLAEKAGFSIGPMYKFIAVIGDGIGKEHFFSGEKLTTLLALFKYDGAFENALDMMRAIYEVGGKGHSCGIYSFNQDHIHRLGLAAPVSRIMVRQPQNKANAGAYTNGMPMTNSMGCGTWGGNIISENIALRQYMNVTWVSVPIPEDKPSDAWLFGEFYDPQMDA